MIREEDYFKSLTHEELWQRYCGFLYLDIDTFMKIQEELLVEQIKRVEGSILGEKIMKNLKPRSVEEFRQVVPLTTYEDYEPFLSERREEALAEKPFAWCHSAGRGGFFKWIPHTIESAEKTIRNFTAAFILASTNEEGDVRIPSEFSILSVVPPRPYASGWLLHVLEESLSCRVIPSTREAEHLEFEERIKKGFQIALKDGADTAFALSSILVKMGEAFSKQTGRTESSSQTMHPKALLRMMRGLLRAKKERRHILPKDLWQLKGIVTGGMDTTIYKDDIKSYWGLEPYEIYASSDAAFMAMQAWNKKGMTFVPDSVFLEFIPQNRDAQEEPMNDQPASVLLNEVRPGRLYEVVITHLYGGPLLRYRMKDLVKFVSMTDDETRVKLPQMVFQRRAGETINLGGLTALDEKTIWQAITRTGISYVEWSACKEYDGDQSFLRVYLELGERKEKDEIEYMVDKQLKILDPDYKDVNRYLGLQPVRVTLLSPGTFDRYTTSKKELGYDLAHLKPRHINPSDTDIECLCELSTVQES